MIHDSIEIAKGGSYLFNLLACSLEKCHPAEDFIKDISWLADRTNISSWMLELKISF